MMERWKDMLKLLLVLPSRAFRRGTQPTQSTTSELLGVINGGGRFVSSVFSLGVFYQQSLWLQSLCRVLPGYLLIQRLSCLLKAISYLESGCWLLAIC